MPPQAPAAGLVDASWDDVVRAVARQHGVNPSLALAVAKKESNRQQTDPKTGKTVLGDGGNAVGMFQLHEAAAKDAGITDRNDPIQNITGGVKYLRQLSDRYQGDLNKTLMAYNGGMANVDGGSVSPQAQAYASEVLANLSADMRATSAVGTGVPQGGRGGGAGIGPPQSMISTDLPTPKTLFSPFNPMTPEGRSNLTATAADVGISIATRGMPVGTLTTRIAQTLAPAIGAGIATAAERGVEQLLGTVEDDAALKTGAQQTAMTLAAQTFLWPLRRLGRALIAPKVATTAEAQLRTGIDKARDAGRLAVQEVENEVAIVQRHMQQQTKQATRAVAADVGAATATAKRLAAERVAATELTGAATIADVTKQYDSLLAHVPSQLAGGKAVRQTLEGPTKRALDLAGQRVAEAAETGPPIALAPIRDVLREMVEQHRPGIVFPAVAKATPSSIGARPVGVTTGGKMSVEDFQKYMAGKLGVPETHPLPGLLGKIESIDPTTSHIPFKDAHQIKMLLDEAVNWDRTAKKHVEKITKGLRLTLREQMTGHADYDAATAAYQAVVPLYRKGVGRRLLQLANTPDGTAKLATMLEKSDAAQAMTLRQLLVDQAAAGGDALTGQRAWDAVRSSFTFDKVIAGGIDGLGSRIEKLVTLKPEFVRTVYGDTSGQNVLKNLGALSEAYKQAEATVAAQITAAKAAGAAGTAEAKAVGEFAQQSAQDRAAEQLAKTAAEGKSRVQVARRMATGGVQSAKDTLKEFEKTDLGKNWTNRSLLAEGADITRFAALGLGSYWGALSALRLLKAPPGRELLEWAAYSNQNTQRMVRLLTQPGPAAGAALALREITGLAGIGPSQDVAQAQPAVPSRAVGAGPAAGPGRAPAP